VEVVASANLAVRFALEVGALAALACAGFRAPGRRSAQVGLAVGAPLVAAVVWSVLVAPGPDTRLPDPWRLIPELLVFGSAAAGLALAGRPRLGAAFAAAAVLNSVLDRALGL
jgi:hypothetical protein